MKRVRNLIAKNFLQPQKSFVAKESPQTRRINKPHFKSVEKCSVFIIFECSHDVVFKTCWLEFWKSGKIYRFKICLQNSAVSIFLHFQNVPASCECSLRAYERRIFGLKLSNFQLHYKYLGPHLCA